MPLSQEEATAAFSAADSNGDGTVTLEEYKAWLASTGTAWSPDHEAQFHAADNNSDGNLDLQEWLALHC